MKLMLILGIHLLLMLVYAGFVITGHSRMHWLHLLLALLFPFVGECCLLLAEVDSMPASPIYTSPFRRKRHEPFAATGARLPDDWREQLHKDEASARSFLLDVISRNCSGLADVLQEALRVPGSEVPHIAASTLMKLNTQYEDRISLAQRRYEDGRENISYLCTWIDAVDAYRLSGLNNAASLQALVAEEIALIRRYLSVMQKDTQYRPILIALLKDQAPDQAYEEACILLKLLPDAPESWNLALASCQAAGHPDYQALLHKARLVCALWHPAQRQQLHKWEEIFDATKA